MQIGLTCAVRRIGVVDTLVAALRPDTVEVDPVAHCRPSYPQRAIGVDRHRPSRGVTVGAAAGCRRNSTGSTIGIAAHGQPCSRPEQPSVTSIGVGVVALALCAVEDAVYRRLCSVKSA